MVHSTWVQWIDLFSTKWIAVEKSLILNCVATIRSWKFFGVIPENISIFFWLSPVLRVSLFIYFISPIMGAANSPSAKNQSIYCERKKPRKINRKLVNLFLNLRDIAYILLLESIASKPVEDPMIFHDFRAILAQQISFHFNAAEKVQCKNNLLQVKHVRFNQLNHNWWMNSIYNYFISWTFIQRTCLLLN